MSPSSGEVVHEARPQPGAEADRRQRGLCREGRGEYDEACDARRHPAVRHEGSLLSVARTRLLGGAVGCERRSGVCERSVQALEQMKIHDDRPRTCRFANKIARGARRSDVTVLSLGWSYNDVDIGRRSQPQFRMCLPVRQTTSVRRMSRNVARPAILFITRRAALA